MYGLPGLLGETAKEREIAALALAFATDENRNALRPKGTSTAHPICGTAP